MTCYVVRNKGSVEVKKKISEKGSVKQTRHMFACMGCICDICYMFYVLQYPKIMIFNFNFNLFKPICSTKLDYMVYYNIYKNF